MALCDNDLIMAGAVTTVVSRPGDVFSLQFDTYNTMPHTIPHTIPNTMPHTIPYTMPYIMSHTMPHTHSRYNLPQQLCNINAMTQQC